jgi:ZIP family zinc transporter
MVTALLLTILAASTTILGGWFSVLLKKDNPKGLGLSLSFSAGVMLYLSFMEILPKGMQHLAKGGYDLFYGLLAFFTGLITIIIVDKLTPHVGHDLTPVPDKERLKHIGLLSLILITVHNFPEGMAVYSVATESLSLSWPVIIAIGIHNFPEGIFNVCIFIRVSRAARRFNWVLLI